MNILDLTRKEVEFFISTGVMRPENLRHYDICKAMADGKTQDNVTREFGYSDIRAVRYVKHKKCPQCPEGKSS